MPLHQLLGRHYFDVKIDFLAWQSVTLGNHHILSADKMTPISYVKEEIHLGKIPSIGIRLHA